MFYFLRSFFIIFLCTARRCPGTEKISRWVCRNETLQYRSYYYIASTPYDGSSKLLCPRRFHILISRNISFLRRNKNANYKWTFVVHESQSFISNRRKRFYVQIYCGLLLHNNEWSTQYITRICIWEMIERDFDIVGDIIYYIYIF